MSPRRAAHFGILSIALLLVSSLSVLVASSRDNTFHSLTAPSFTATDVGGKPLASTELKGKTTVLYFFSTRCAVSNDYTERAKTLAHRFAEVEDVEFVGVHSTAASYRVPAQHVRVQSQVSGLTFRTLDDHDGSLASKFRVTRTPTIVVIDADGLIRYRGAIDDSRDPSAVKAAWAQDAVAAVLAGQAMPVSATMEVGCEIFKD